MPAAVNLFLFGLDRQQLFFAFLSVQELAGLLGSHLAGSTHFGFFLLLLLRGILRLRWCLIGLLLSLLLFLLLLGLLILLVLVLIGFALLRLLLLRLRRRGFAGRQS